MSDNILDIRNWEQEYPFLDTVRVMYKKFDKPIQEDFRKNNYDVVCSKIITDLNGDIGKHKTYCMKLIRNLGHYYIDDNYFDPTFERCNILYNWLYHSSRGENNLDVIIEKCFKDCNDQMIGMGRICKCDYDLYKNMVRDQMKLNILNLFHYNAEVLRERLMGTDDSNKTRCRNFVCECLKIYKPMKEKYCFRQEQRQKHEKICLELDQFNNAYKIFYNKLLHTNPKIPSLDDINNKDFPRCISDEPKLESGLGLAGGGVHVVGLESQSEGISHVAEQSDNGTSVSKSTVLSSMVGIPPFLALIYKFTPVGTIFRSKNNRSINVFNNLDGEGEKELFYPSHRDALINSSLETYNVGYGSV